MFNLLSLYLCSVYLKSWQTSIKHNLLLWRKEEKKEFFFTLLVNNDTTETLNFLYFHSIDTTNLLMTQNYK